MEREKIGQLVIGELERGDTDVYRKSAIQRSSI